MTILAPVSGATIRLSRALVARGRGTVVCAAIVAAGLVASAVLVVEIEFPAMAVGLPRGALEMSEIGQSSRIVDREGRLLARLDESFHRRVVPLEEIPQTVRDAVVSIEDASFWDHEGVDMAALARAALANIKSGEVEQGGSTITMQLARASIEGVGRGQNIGRKVREILAAVRIEDRMTKRDILDAYLNRIYFGRGAYGIDAAARAYFGRPVTAIGPRAAATLAGLIHAPSSYRNRPEALRARRNLVLDRMVRTGALERARAERFKRMPLGIRPFEIHQARAPYFVEYVKKVLRAPPAEGGYGMTTDDLLRGGYTITTTLDLKAQRAAERAVAKIADRARDPEVAMVALTTGGAVRAMIGGRSQRVARARGFNFAVQRAPRGGRSPGSTFKPFALAAYVEDDGDLTQRFPAPGTDHIDECEDEDGPWEVSNYDHRSYGSLDPIRATEDSVNTAYANIAVEVGPDRIAEMAERLGVESPLDAVCSIVLGSSGVTPMEMARAYGTFAGRGLRPEVVAVHSIVGPDGSIVARGAFHRERVIGSDVADSVNAVLERVMDNGTGTPARIDRPAAGKTGTSEGKRDLWFVGYTPHPGLVAAVWVGHRGRPGGQPPRVRDVPGRSATGGGFAGAIWREFMERALRGTPERDFRDVDLWERSDEVVRIIDDDQARVIVREEPAGTRPERRERAEPKPAPKPKPVGKPTEEPEPEPRPQQSEEPDPPPASDDGQQGGAQNDPTGEPTPVPT